MCRAVIDPSAISFTTRMVRRRSTARSVCATGGGTPGKISAVSHELPGWDGAMPRAASYLQGWEAYL